MQLHDNTCFRVRVFVCVCISVMFCVCERVYERERDRERVEGGREEEIRACKAQKSEVISEVCEVQAHTLLMRVDIK